MDMYKGYPADIECRGGRYRGAEGFVDYNSGEGMEGLSKCIMYFRRIPVDKRSGEDKQRYRGKSVEGMLL